MSFRESLENMGGGERHIQTPFVIPWRTEVGGGGGGEVTDTQTDRDKEKERSSHCVPS